MKVLLSTDAKEKCFKRGIKIYIKTGATCFGVITVIGSALFELPKVTVDKIVNLNTMVWLAWWCGYICSHTTRLTTPMDFN
jgi:hypothetical protein